MTARILAAGIALALLPAGPAAAATVSVAGGAAQYAASGGEANAVTVRARGDLLTVHDDRTPLAAGAGCAAVDARTVTCAVANPNPSLTLALGDGDDLLAAGDAPGWAIRADGGPGADVLRGGPDDDVLGGGAGNDVLGGEAGEDRLDGGGGADRLLPGVAGVAGDRVRCGAGRDTVTVTPRLDAPLLRPECEQITAGVLRVERWSFPAALRLAVRAAPGERACRVRIRGPEDAPEVRLRRRRTTAVRLRARIARVELRVEPLGPCAAGGAFALRLARPR